MLAARAIGARDWWMMLSHIFPNTISLVVISLTINAGSLILVESGLSYLGLGVQPPTPTGQHADRGPLLFRAGTHLVIRPGS
jgi:ABC-type dipeptide/oligopeptide/nickel transport system permease subunit